MADVREALQSSGRRARGAAQQWREVAPCGGTYRAVGPPSPLPPPPVVQAGRAVGPPSPLPPPPVVQAERAVGSPSPLHAVRPGSGALSGTTQVIQSCMIRRSVSGHACMIRRSVSGHACMARRSVSSHAWTHGSVGGAGRGDVELQQARPGR